MTDDLLTAINEGGQALHRLGKQLAETDRADLQEAWTLSNERSRRVAQVAADYTYRMSKVQALLTTISDTSMVEIDAVLAEMMDTIVSLVGAERVYLLMATGVGGSLEMRAARNWDQKALSERDVEVSQTVVQMTLENRKPVLTTNAQTDVRFSTQASIISSRPRSIIAVPLLIADKPIGVLYADNRYKMAAFSEDAVPLLEAFGTMAAIAVLNAQIYSGVQRKIAAAQEELAQAHISGRLTHEDTERLSLDKSYFEQIGWLAKQARSRYNRD